MATTASFRYYPRSGFESRMDGGIFQGSTDGSTWVNLATIVGSPTSGVYSVLNASVDLTTYGWIRYLSPSTGYGNVSELEFYNGTYGSGGVLIPPNVIIASTFSGGNPPSYAFDANTTTFFEGSGASGQYVGIDRRPLMSSIRLFPRSGQEGRMTAAQFQGSNDYITGTLLSGTWTTLYTIPSTPAAGWNVYDTPSDVNAYRYLRYYGSTGDYGNVAELEFYKGGTYSTTGTKVTYVATFGTAGSFSGTSSDTYPNALDGNTATFFDSAQPDNNIIGIDRGSLSPISLSYSTNLMMGI